MKLIRRPHLKDVAPQSRFLCSMKVGCDMSLVSVICKGAPYQASYGKNRVAWYVDVYGYGINQAILVKKLIIPPTLKDVADFEKYLKTRTFTKVL